MTGRIYITGDKHGAMFLISRFAENNPVNENDILLIAGDTEYVWNEDYIYNVETLHQIFPGIIAFIDGNHDNHVLLNQFEMIHWNGGKVHKIGERVFHLMRGEIYSIYGKNIFTFGGARSADKDRRTEGVSWWKEEEPNIEELAYGRKRLLDAIEEIDYVVTHETPLSARSYIKRQKQIENDYALPETFEEWYRLCLQEARFKKWYFGHMHTDQEISSGLQAVFNKIYTIGDA